MPLSKDEYGSVIIPEGMTHKVYATSSWQLDEMLRAGDITGGSITKSHMCGYEEWVLVGFIKAEFITIDQQEMKDNLVESLRQQAKNIQATAHMKCNEIEKKVQQLLAITYESKGE